jgi:hypothetical protein
MHGQFSTWAINKKEILTNLCCKEGQKFTLEDMIDGLSLTIFAINGIYILITLFDGLNMLIQCILTLCKILLPFTFIKSANLKNFMCFSGLWKKNEHRDYSNPHMHGRPWMKSHTYRMYLVKLKASCTR